MNKRSIVFSLVAGFLFGYLSYFASIGTEEVDAEVAWRKYIYYNNIGGLNTTTAPTEIADNESPDMQNVVFDLGGSIVKRFGYISVPSNNIKVASGTSSSITGLTIFRKSDGSRYLVAMTNNDGKATPYYKSYTVGGGLVTGSWTNIDSPLLPSSYSDNYQASFATAQDTLVITVPSTTGKQPFKWTGSGNVVALTSDTDVPNSSLCCYHFNTLFLSGDITYRSRVWFSAQDDIEDYTSTDWFDVETSDGSIVRGMVSALDSLYIFKDRSIWRLSGTNKDDFTLQKMVDGIGTMSGKSIAVVNNIIMFASSNGDLCAYDGGYTVQFISQKLKTTISGLNYSRSNNILGLAFSSYRNSDSDYYVANSLAGSGINNQVLLFDNLYKAWTKFSGMEANAWCVGDSDSGKPVMFFGDTNGYVFQYPTSTYHDDNTVTGSTIEAYYTTKWFRYEESCLGEKYLRMVKTNIYTQDLSTSNICLEVRTDYMSVGTEYIIPTYQGGSLWDSAVWDIDIWSGQSLYTHRLELGIGTNMFQLKYSNETDNDGMTVFGFTMFIEPSDRI